MAANLSREFLVQRLVADARNRQQPPAAALSVGSNSDGEEPAHSDSSSDPGGGPEDKLGGNSETFAPFTHPAMSSRPFFPQHPLQYAATLASLAQMNFLQPGAAANTLPLLYPHLYQSLLTFPNLEQLRLALQSPAGHLQSPKTAENFQKISVKTPESGTFSPSPRKRPSSHKPPTKSEKSSGNPTDGLLSPLKKPRAVKRLQFDEETSSPVSGMYIKDAEELPPPAQLQAQADLDDSAKFVEITEEAKAEIAKIPNLIGDYVCCLCKVKYEDPFKLAQHRCPRIVHEEYRCPECDKVFSCPANLASHRRWHKPRNNGSAPTNQLDEQQQLGPINLSKVLEDERAISSTSRSPVASFFLCEICRKKFESHRILKSHAAVAHTEFGMDVETEEESECPEIGCDLWFPSADAVEKHVKTAHPKFLCKFCAETFPTSPSLTRHINKYHPTNECKVILLEEFRKKQNNNCSETHNM